MILNRFPFNKKKFHLNETRVPSIVSLYLYQPNNTNKVLINLFPFMVTRYLKSMSSNNWNYKYVWMFCYTAYCYKEDYCFYISFRIRLTVCARNSKRELEGILIFEFRAHSVSQMRRCQLTRW